MAAQETILGGRYRLLDVLGDGGMARVFRAEDERLGRIVAVKVLHQQYTAQPEFVRRFEQEAQLAASLAHPNIVSIYDVGSDDEAYFIVMEYVEGSSLKALITREGPLRLNRIIPIMRQLGQALDFAHAHGVIHRDVKPENILLTPSDHVKVGDFGIARALTSPGQTATGIVLGSVSYFSPEQAQGKPATAESDIYSSGIVLYEMLTGRLPFAADNPLATAMQHITQQPLAPNVLVPALPPGVDDVVLTALNKNPAARFHSGVALADALAAAAAAPPIGAASGAGPGRSPVGTRSAAQAHAARTLRMPQPVPATPSRRRAPMVSLLLLLLLGGGAVYAAIHSPGLGTLFGSGSPATPTPTVAPRDHATATTTARGGIAGAATSTPTAMATAAPSSSPTAAHSTATPTPSPSVSTTPSPTNTATAGVTGQTSADIVTAGNYHFGASSIPEPVGPTDTFSTPSGLGYAILHIHNLPRNVRIGVRWTFPDGRIIKWYCPAAQCPHHAFSADYIYWASQQLAGPGSYAVAALINGTAVGSHPFKVVAPGSAPGASAPATATATPSAAQPQIAVQVKGAAVHVDHAHGRAPERHGGNGDGNGGNRDGNGSGDEQGDAVALS